VSRCDGAGGRLTARGRGLRDVLAALGQAQADSHGGQQHGSRKGLHRGNIRHSTHFNLLIFSTQHIFIC